MKNTKIKWLIYVMAIGLFLSACGVRESDREGTKAEAAETIETSLENSPEETEPDAVSSEETGTDAESPEKTGAGETASGESSACSVCPASMEYRPANRDSTMVRTGSSIKLRENIAFFMVAILGCHLSRSLY